VVREGYMDKEKKLFDAIESESYNASHKPFDFIEEGGKTALVCEADSAIRIKLRDILKEMGYYVRESATEPDSLRSMRFHVYHLIVVGEDFDANGADADGVLGYIRQLPMNIRRNIFVVLMSSEFRTMDNMAAFEKSVNLVVNLENIDEAGVVIERGIADNDAFYRSFKDALKQAGRL
jgi:CheY-like chemotaxis protein